MILHKENIELDFELKEIANGETSSFSFGRREGYTGLDIFWHSSGKRAASEVGIIDDTPPPKEA